MPLSGHSRIAEVAYSGGSEMSEGVLESLMAEFEVMRADAARYRWLVENEVVFVRGRFSISLDGTSRLIDAAIRNATHPLPVKAPS